MPRALRVVATVLLACCAVGTALRVFGVSEGPLVGVVGLAPLVGLAYLAPLLLAAATRTTLVAVLSAVGLLVHVGWLAPYLVADGPRQGDRLTVLSTNLEYGGADLADIRRLVAANDVDLLSVQELTPDAADELTAALGNALPHSYTEPEPSSAGGTGIWSRFPIRERRTVDPMLFRNLRATVELGQGRGELAFVAVHPVPPGVGGPDDLDQRTLRSGLTDLAGAYERVVVAGDFNATVDHPPLRELRALGYADAADRAGAGIVPTWPVGGTIPTAFGIDHVLASGDVGVTEFRRELVPHTDHYAVLADLVLP